MKKVPCADICFFFSIKNFYKRRNFDKSKCQIYKIVRLKIFSLKKYKTVPSTSIIKCGQMIDSYTDHLQIMYSSSRIFYKVCRVWSLELYGIFVFNFIPVWFPSCTNKCFVQGCDIIAIGKNIFSIKLIV